MPSCSRVGALNLLKSPLSIISRQPPNPCPSLQFIPVLVLSLQRGLAVEPVVHPFLNVHYNVLETDSAAAGALDHQNPLHQVRPRSGAVEPQSEPDCHRSTELLGTMGQPQ